MGSWIGRYDVGYISNAQREHSAGKTGDLFRCMVDIFSALATSGAYFPLHPSSGAPRCWLFAG